MASDKLSTRLAVCGVIGILFFILSVFKIRSRKEAIVQAHKWEASEWWESAECTPLAVGVACTEIDTGYVCDYSPPSVPYTASRVSSMEGLSTQLVFDNGAASCPGHFVCANEGYECVCKGKVTYAAVLFDGATYETNLEHVISNGEPLLCSHEPEKQGAFSYDPKPGYTKWCFCMPSDAVEMVKAHKSAMQPGKRTCASEANLDFRSAEKSSRRLAGYVPDNFTKARRLADTRRTYRMTPWALVKVHEQSSFFAEAATQVRCAYPYGSAEAQAEDYDVYPSPGPSGYTAFNYDRDYSGAGKLFKQWTGSSSLPCWVRKKGVASNDACAVALFAPGSLEKTRVGNLKDAWKFEGNNIVFYVLCSIGCFACAYVMNSVEARETSEATVLNSNGASTCQYKMMIAD